MLVRIGRREIWKQYKAVPAIVGLPLDTKLGQQKRALQALSQEAMPHATLSSLEVVCLTSYECSRDGLRLRGRCLP